MSSNEFNQYWSNLCVGFVAIILAVTIIYGLLVSKARLDNDEEWDRDNDEED